MEKTTISTKKYILTQGLILGFIWVLYGFFRLVTGTRDTANWAFSIFELSLYIGFIFYSIHKYKSSNGSFLTLWQALKVGFGIAFISIIMQKIGNIFFIEVIPPETIQEIFNSTDKAPVKELQERNKTVSNENDYLIAMFFSLIFNLVIGFIISLFAGAIMQKDPDPFD
ncbi:DUF4199 domain-containing protein [Aquimarina gracilis]|uniref:DUF4199 domain-containing protein n=1 Tax=Aquimarina gracilis TaxID=874422 RepID=A0ABU5ZW83_9FLAO|nr:DUF4199 domain-containing protein [Aquimarina gracilis]MEB3346110.1 DUF4199 domain-containing protein [Aquimarina gracilis]